MERREGLNTEFLPKSPQRQREANLSLGKHSRHDPQPQSFHSCHPQARFPEFSGAPESPSHQKTPARSKTKLHVQGPPRGGVRLSKETPKDSQIATHLGEESSPESSLALDTDWPTGSGFPETTAKQEGESSVPLPPKSSGIPQGIPLSPSTHRHGQGLIQLPEHLLQESQPEAPRRTVGGSKSS